MKKMIIKVKKEQVQLVHQELVIHQMKKKVKMKK